jgi:hypothetical protein
MPQGRPVAASHDEQIFQGFVPCRGPQFKSHTGSFAYGFIDTSVNYVINVTEALSLALLPFLCRGAYFENDGLLVIEPVAPFVPLHQSGE